MAEQILDRWGIELYLNKEAFKKGLKETEQGLDRFNKKLEAFGAGVGKWSGRAFVGLAGLGVVTVRAMQKAEAATAKARVVFGRFFGDLEKWALAFGEQFPVATHELMLFASQTQDLFVPMGIAREEAAKLSKRFVELATKVAVFNGQPTTETLMKLTSALVGQHETARRYGILIDENRIKQEALNQGWVTGNDEVSQTHKVMARLNIMYSDSTDALRGAAGQLDTTTGELMKMRKAMSELSVAAGKAFVPALKSLAETLVAVDTNTREVLKNNERVIQQLTSMTIQMTGATFAANMLFGPKGALVTFALVGGVQLGRMLNEIIFGIERMRKEAEETIEFTEKLQAAFEAGREKRVGERATGLEHLLGLGVPAREKARRFGLIAREAKDRGTEMRALVKAFSKLSKDASQEQLMHYLDVLDRVKTEMEKLGVFAGNTINDVLRPAVDDLLAHIADSEKQMAIQNAKDRVEAIEDQRKAVLNAIKQEQRATKEALTRIQQDRRQAVQEYQQALERVAQIMRERQRRLERAGFGLEQLGLRRHELRRRGFEEQAEAAAARGHGVHAAGLRRMAEREGVAEQAGQQQIARRMLERAREVTAEQPEYARELAREAQSVFRNFVQSAESVEELNEALKEMEATQKVLSQADDEAIKKQNERMEELGPAIEGMDKLLSKLASDMKKSAALAAVEIIQLGSELINLKDKNEGLEAITKSADKMGESVKKTVGQISDLSRGLDEISRKGTIKVRIDVEGISDADVAALATRMSSQITREQDEAGTGLIAGRITAE